MSDQVLTAMLSGGQNVAATAAQAAPQPTPTGLTSDWANSNPQPAPAAPQFAPAYEAAAPVYAQPAPVYAYPAPATAITTLGLTTQVIPHCRSVCDSGAVITMAATTGEVTTAVATTVAVVGNTKYIGT